MNFAISTWKKIINLYLQIFYLSQDIDLRNQPIGSLFKEILDQNQITFKKEKFSIHLDYFELDDTVLDCISSQLSGGERQRIGLIPGILLDRPVWLLDEPTSTLDDEMKIKTAQYVLDQNKTILIISHDPVWQRVETINSI